LVVADSHQPDASFAFAASAKSRRSVQPSTPNNSVPYNGLRQGDADGGKGGLTMRHDHRWLNIVLIIWRKRCTANSSSFWKSAGRKRSFCNPAVNWRCA